jgi:hypothetical protein
MVILVLSKQLKPVNLARKSNLSADRYAWEANHIT